MLDLVIRLCDGHQRLLAKPWLAALRFVLAGVFDGLMAAFVIAIGFTASAASGVLAVLVLVPLALWRSKRNPNVYRAVFAATVSAALFCGWLFAGQRLS